MRLEARGGGSHTDEPQHADYGLPRPKPLSTWPHRPAARTPLTWMESSLAGCCSQLWRFLKRSVSPATVVVLCATKNYWTQAGFKATVGRGFFFFDSAHCASRILAPALVERC